jgi:hypothetical protein
LEYEFTVDGDDLVAVVLSDNLALMNEALEDSIGTHPPVGAPQHGPTTYWIDEALRDLRARIEDNSREPFASGNLTYLQLTHGAVQARYDFDAEEDEVFDAVPASEFLDLLVAWRRRVLAESPSADQRIPPPRQARAMPPG